MESVWDHMKRQRHWDSLNPQKNCGSFSNNWPAQYLEKSYAGGLRRPGAGLKTKRGHSKQWQIFLFLFMALLLKASSLCLVSKTTDTVGAPDEGVTCKQESRYSRNYRTGVAVKLNSTSRKLPQHVLVPAVCTVHTQRGSESSLLYLVVGILPLNQHTGWTSSGLEWHKSVWSNNMSVCVAQPKERNGLETHLSLMVCVTMTLLCTGAAEVIKHCTSLGPWHTVEDREPVTAANF